MENELHTLYTAREAALSIGDADAYNAANLRIREIVAFMAAEIRLGLREDPIFTHSVR